MDKTPSAPDTVAEGGSDMPAWDTNGSEDKPVSYIAAADGWVGMLALSTDASAGMPATRYANKVAVVAKARNATDTATGDNHKVAYAYITMVAAMADTTP